MSAAIAQTTGTHMPEDRQSDTQPHISASFFGKSGKMTGKVCQSPRQRQNHRSGGRPGALSNHTRYFHSNVYEHPRNSLPL
jgi:hypothetical protein